jgi:diaminohydroxyphosphoribosylaminopyrimidine deaminase/5-amino-6-(5-phosphoribosylamino)uracil reductase
LSRGLGDVYKRQGLGMANIASLNQLSDRQDWTIIDHRLIGGDLRIRAVPNKAKK